MILNRIKRQIQLTALTLLSLIGLKQSKAQALRQMSRSRYVPHQGKRECARRIRQGLTHDS